MATLDRVTIDVRDFLDPKPTADVRGMNDGPRACGFAEMSMSRDNSDVHFVNAGRVFALRAWCG
jgi:hypothetical protein